MKRNAAGAAGDNNAVASVPSAASGQHHAANGQPVSVDEPKTKKPKKEPAELLTVQDKAKDLSKRALAKATAINKITLALTVLPYAQAVKSELDSYHDKFKHLGSMLNVS